MYLTPRSPSIPVPVTLFLRLTTPALLALAALGCTTGVESSPDPGILVVTLQSDPADTLIVIANDTVTVADGDWFGVTVFQGKVYRDTNYAFLFTDTSSYRLEDQNLNLLQMDGATGQYQRFVLYRSYVPPGDYDRIQFGITPVYVQVGNLYIPVTLPPGTGSLVDLYRDFAVFENRTTAVSIRISPFKSVTRYRDSFYFTPVIEIVEITTP